MSLNPRFVYGSLDLTDYPYALEFGAEYGAPENVTQVLNSLLVDGELLSVDRTSNRTMTVSISIMGADLSEVAAAEAALVREANQQRNTLTIDPGDGFAVPTAFDTFRAGITFARSDAGEMATLRRYVLTIPALPYGRSETLTTEVAEAIPSVGTLLASCDSTTGWSSRTPTLSPAPSPMFSVDTADKIEGTGSLVVQPYQGDGSPVSAAGVNYYSYTHYASTTVSSTAAPAGSYFSFAAKFTSSDGYYYSGGFETAHIQAVGLGTTTGGLALNLDTAAIQSLGNGWKRYTFVLPSSVTITSLTIVGSQWRAGVTGSPYPTMKLDQVAVAVSATFGKQVLKRIDVGGSARTTGAIHVAAPSDAVALGKVVVYTTPQSDVPVGFMPDLRQWTVSGATSTSDSPPSGSALSGISGQYDDVGAPILSAPASIFASGPVTIAALLYSASAIYSISIEAALMIDTSVVGTQELTASITQDVVEQQTWQPRVLGTMYLPPVGIMSPTTNAKVRFRLKSPNGPKLDELWVFPTSGDLTIIDCGSGTVGPAASSHLWIDAPSPEQPEGGYWRGDTPTRSNAIGIQTVSAVKVPGTHTFEPGIMLAFASAEVNGPIVSFDYYERCYFHAAG